MMLKDRREAFKNGDDEKYKQIVLQSNQMDQMYDQKMIQTVFEKLGVSQQEFMASM